MINYEHATYRLNLIQACWQNKWKMMLIFILVFGLAVGYLFIAKAKYTSEAQLFVRLGKESVALDPTATTGQTVAVQESRETEIFSVQSLIKSRAVLEQVVDRVGIERILCEDGDKEPSMLPIDVEYVKSLSPVYVDSPRDEAIKTLEEGLEIYTPRATAIIGLRYETKSPELAAEVLQALIDATVTAQVRIHQSEGSSNFFIQQSENLVEQVDALELRLLKFKNSSGVADLNQQREVEIARVARLENSLLDVDSQLEGVESEIQARREALVSQPDQIRLAETTGLPSTAAQGMREQLFALQLEEKELLARYQADHPRVAKIKEQIAAAQQTMQSEQTLTQVTLGINESRREMESSLLNQVAVAASLKARKQALTKQVAHAQAELTKINEHEQELVQLNRKLDLARASYLDYAKRAEQSRIDLALSDQNLSNLSILQPPSQSLIPSSPKVPLTLFLGATAAAFLSMFVAVIAHLASRTVYSPAHIDLPDVPHLGDVAHMPRRRILSSESEPGERPRNEQKLTDAGAETSSSASTRASTEDSGV